MHPHVLEFLQALQRAGKRRVLVTNAHQKSLQLKLQKTRLSGSLDAVISSHDIGLPKENPQFWNRLQKRVHFSPASSLFIDDSVSVLLETPNHSYYQIEVNPDGTLFDADRKTGLVTRWCSQAKVKTEKGKNHWRATITIPVVAPEKNEGDPYHYVVGPKPSRKKMWYLNVGRNRMRGKERTSQTFIPTGRTYHKREKFAKLVVE